MSDTTDLLDHPELAKVWVALESAAEALDVEDLVPLAARELPGGRRRSLSRPIAIALAALVVVTVAVSQFPFEQSAAAAVSRAIERQAGVESYEAVATTEYGDGSIESSTVRVDGDDAEVASTLQHPDGSTESFTITEVGDEVYADLGGEKTVSPQLPDSSIQPSIAELSQALGGVLDSSEIAEVGTDVIAGSEATRYQIELGSESRVALADPVLGFDPARVVEQITIWVADDYPRQVEWLLDDGEHTVVTFVTVGQDLDIVAPAGDYMFDPTPGFFDG